MKRSNKILVLVGGGVFLVVLALLLAWVSFGFSSTAAWPSFLALELLMVGVGWAAFYHFRGEAVPKWLIWLVLGAVLLRLVLGVFWFWALPVWGYPNETQQAGYIMYDPFLRDADAWRLAHSGTSLTEAFHGFSAHDQYGGLLFLSALVYRTLGFGEHIPQLMLLVTSTISGLGVLYGWGFTRRLWGRPVAKWAAVGLAVYPEAVLLGSAHMREAFTITFGAAIGFLLLRLWQEKNWRDLLVLFLILFLASAVSWAYVLQLALVLMFLAVGLTWERISTNKLSQLQVFGLGLAGVAIAAVGVYFWRTLEKMSDFQGYLTQSYSGMVQAIFSRTPEFLHTPFLLGYGITRPLLPAALIGKGESVFWRVIGVGRALGWSVLLALLLYALFQVFRNRAWLKPAGMLLWGNLIVMLVAAYRAGGDLWDNPRYRAGFAAFQLALAAWALVQQRKQQDPWLRRILVLVLIQIFWLVIWYLPRYLAVPWGVTGAMKMVGVGIVTGGLYLLGEWVKGQPNE